MAEEKKTEEKEEKDIEIVEENDVEEPEEEKKPNFVTGFSWKRNVVTIFLMFVTAAAVGGTMWWVMNRNAQDNKASFDKSSQEMQNTIDTLKGKILVLEDEIDHPTTTDWHVYQNTQYGFQLTFPESWKGYKVWATGVTGSARTFYVELPTEDENWKNASSTNEAGYVSIFAISAYTADQWTADQAQPVKATYVGKSGNYTFGYSSAQAMPENLQSKASDVKTIIGTFKKL